MTITGTGIPTAASSPPLSRKQQELRERDSHILRVARQLALELGYHGFTMDHVAKASECPKGTLYHRFISKEDILVALATESLTRRFELMRRASAFQGRPRERALALGEAVGIFTRLNPSDSRILHMATGPVREKAAPERVVNLFTLERETVEIYRDVLREAVRVGDLEAETDSILDEITLGTWGLVDGVYTLIEGGIVEHSLRIDSPFSQVWCFFNRTADAYGWQPRFNEWNYDETMATIRKQIFPEEAQALYGEGQWYGDHC
ncbi:MAG: TetR/AcrR family transcriptional regulator [Candidatus Hydrogenedentes bacterium]|nr:TetR/AcrR family transcriptional regulator [Candidatus Hydrogenedentota bacterium]